MLVLMRRSDEWILITVQDKKIWEKHVCKLMVNEIKWKQVILGFDAPKNFIEDGAGKPLPLGQYT